MMTLFEDVMCSFVVVAVMAMIYQAGKADFLHAMCQIFAEKAKQWEETVQKMEETNSEDQENNPE